MANTLVGGTIISCLGALRGKTQGGNVVDRVPASARYTNQHSLTLCGQRLLGSVLSWCVCVINIFIVPHTDPTGRSRGRISGSPTMKDIPVWDRKR